MNWLFGLLVGLFVGFDIGVGYALLTIRQGRRWMWRPW